jgi:hypothetical protein
MKTPLLDGIRKQASFGSTISKGLSYLMKNPRAGSMALGGLAGGGIGLLSGGDLKSALVGAGLGTAGGYGAQRFLGLDPRLFWQAARRGNVGLRRWGRGVAQAGRAAV